MCLPLAALACKHSEWLIRTSEKMICLSAKPCGLHGLVGEVVWADEKMEPELGVEEVGYRKPVSPRRTGDGGGDGRGSVRPAALLWRVTSSAGPRLCGSSTKPRRGQREECYA